MRILFLIFISMCVAAVSWAETEKVGHHTWSYVIKDGGSVISNVSADNKPCVAISPEPVGLLKIPMKLGGKPVVAIGDRAFYGCAGISSVEIPNSILQIGVNAFEDCTGLKSITVPGSVQRIDPGAFTGCTKLEKATLLSGVKIIGQEVNRAGDYQYDAIPDGVFKNCTNLKSIEIPDSVHSVGSGTFVGCNSLKMISVDKKNKQYSSAKGFLTFQGTDEYGNSIREVVAVPAALKLSSFNTSGFTDIATFAFWGCQSLKEVSVSKEVHINEGAFVFCGSLSSFKVDKDSNYHSAANGLLLADDGLVLICGTAGNVVIPEGVEYISRYAFNGCSGLKSVTIPSSVKEIVEDPFDHCSGLTAFKVDKNNQSYSSVNGLLLSKDGRVLFRGINGNVVVPDTVVNIWARAFSGCTGLKSVTIPPGATYFYPSVFYGCSDLKSITVSEGNGCLMSVDGLVMSPDGKMLLRGFGVDVKIPASVTIIGDEAFSGCAKLKSVTVLAGNDADAEVVICARAFSDCPALKKVVFEKKLGYVAADAFYGAHNCALSFHKDLWEGELPSMWRGCKAKFIKENDGDLHDDVNDAGSKSVKASGNSQKKQGTKKGKGNRAKTH